MELIEPTINHFEGMLKVLSPYNIEAQRYVVIEQKVLQCSIH